MYFYMFLHIYVVQFKLGLLVYIFIIFLHFYFVLHDDKNYLDLININKKSLIVITNNYDIKKEKFLKIQLK